MKNLGIYLVALALIVACKSEDKLEAKKKELTEQKAALMEVMDAVKKLETEIAELDTTNTKKAILVTTEQLTYRPFEHFIQVEGIVEAEQDVMVSFQSQGEIKSILVKEGDQVRKGQVLAKLNAGPLQNQLAELKTRWELANTLFVKQKKLWIDNNIGSEIQYLQAKSNKEALERSMAAVKSQIAMSTVTSPINGIIDKINYKKGAFASPQMPFGQVINLKNLSIVADLSESHLPKVKQGDTVQVDFQSLGFETHVPVSRIGNVINPQNRSFEVELKITNESSMIKPNALATLKIRDYYVASGIVLPSNVVQQDIDGSFVFVAKQNGNEWQAEKRYVETSMSNDNNESLIISGLTVNDKVVTEGYNLLTKGVLITELVDNKKAWK